MVPLYCATNSRKALVLLSFLKSTDAEAIAITQRLAICMALVMCAMSCPLLKGGFITITS